MVRRNLQRKLPYDFEDPVHAYPEAFDISLLFREEEMVNVILQACPGALALETLEMLRMGSEHLMNTWLRLGLRADTFCARVKDINAVRLDIGEVGFHPKCRIPGIQAAESRPRELLQGCFVEGMWKDLPEAWKSCLGLAAVN
eukprot:s4766_g2.t1